jgi:TPR repeat protein
MRLYQWQAFLTSLLLIANGGIAADYAKGFDAYSEGDYATALAEWQPLAEAGDSGGQFGLGLLYANGWGVDLNDDEALKWYGLAAEQGHAEAAYNLGVMCANGWGVPQSDEEAFKWYSMAAERGFTGAQVSLAKMYAVGYGAPLDLVRAHMWFSVAAALGDYNAQFERDELARTMPADDVSKSEQLALVWQTNYQAAPEQ